ncbi:hypothetical protein D3H55_00425 [Bacillus salacetis]|uniref:VOC domain-containing protein n=1 Tax=Bacillus salacetis TaxID=2315464 RepID=A0A3A1R6J7_9BACI|nr:hypothetical protein [Bacillus salacetis]RIW38858.1 hypothetical protein D3H55_00425 [Bacillus salacetis]
MAFGDSPSYEEGKRGVPVICLIEKKDAERGKDTAHPVLGISKEYCEKLYEELQENDVQVEENPSHKGHFKYYDPDGIMLEAYCPGIYD